MSKATYPFTVLKDHIRKDELALMINGNFDYYKAGSSNIQNNAVTYSKMSYPVVCIAYLSANQTIGDAAITQILFDTVERDWSETSYSASSFSTTNSNYVVPSTGCYLVAAQGRIQVEDGQTNAGYIYLDGAEAARVPGHSSGAVATINVVGGSTILYCTAGQTVDFRVYQDNPSNADKTFYGTSRSQSSFTIWRIR